MDLKACEKKKILYEGERCTGVRSGVSTLGYRHTLEG